MKYKFPASLVSLNMYVHIILSSFNILLYFGLLNVSVKWRILASLMSSFLAATGSTL